MNKSKQSNISSSNFENKEEKECLYCAEKINKKCRFFGEWLKANNERLGTIVDSVQKR